MPWFSGLRGASGGQQPTHCMMYVRSMVERVFLHYYPEISLMLVALCLSVCLSLSISLDFSLSLSLSLWPQERRRKAHPAREVGDDGRQGALSWKLTGACCQVSGSKTGIFDYPIAVFFCATVRASPCDKVRAQTPVPCSGDDVANVTNGSEFFGYVWQLNLVTFVNYF